MKTSQTYKDVSLQRFGVKWWMPLFILAISLLWSSGLSGRKFISLHRPLVVKAQKNSPPHIAFEALLESEMAPGDWALIAKIPAQDLAISNSAKISPANQAVRLSEMVITKTVETLQIPDRKVASHPVDSGRLPVQVQPLIEADSAPEDLSWMESLSPAQRKRLDAAEAQSEVLKQNWHDTSWTQTVQKVVTQTPSLFGGKASSAKANSPVSGAAVNPKSYSGRSEFGTASEANEAQEDFPTQVASRMSSAAEGVEDVASQAMYISGPIEISGGLAITNDHHIEVRRNREGVVKELGKVDLQKGLYSISVDDSAGILVAQLINREGRVLGEGQVRLNQATRKGNVYAGPKLRLQPQVSLASHVSSAYGEDHVLPTHTVATFIKGAGDEKIGANKIAALDNVAKGSSTIMRVAGEGHLQTAQVVLAGEETKTQLFSESMMKALQDIIAEQRQLTLPAETRVIWGQALLDGKPQSGIQVEIESESDAEVVYLNELLLPDFGLKATSSNGLYVFIDVNPGFHSLLATKGETIFGYQNVQVEDNSVAVGNIESSSQLETVPLRVYDAFSGEGKSAKAIMQSVSDEVDTEGVSSINLPRVSRLGLMRVQPSGADYIPARYVYSDRDTFIHAPLIQWNWLTTLKSYLRVDDESSVGTVVGFVPDENFEVYLAGYEKLNPRYIVYFDIQGRPVEGSKGVAGGGFIIYNVPPDTHEVVVIGEKSRKIFSRVLPVDVNSLSVLTYR